MKKDLNLRSDARKHDFDCALKGCGFSRTAGRQINAALAAEVRFAR
jgi:hypothetical protein